MLPTSPSVGRPIPSRSGGGPLPSRSHIRRAARDPRREVVPSALERILLAPIAESLGQPRRLVRREDDHCHRRQVLQGIHPNRLDRQGHAVALVDHQHSPAGTAEWSITKQVQNLPHALGRLLTRRESRIRRPLQSPRRRSQGSTRGRRPHLFCRCRCPRERASRGIRGGNEPLEARNNLRLAEDFGKRSGPVFVRQLGGVGPEAVEGGDFRVWPEVQERRRLRLPPLESS